MNGTVLLDRGTHNDSDFGPLYWSSQSAPFQYKRMAIWFYEDNPQPCSSRATKVFPWNRKYTISARGGKTS